MSDPDASFYPKLLETGCDSPCLAFLNTDYTTWDEYKRLSPEKQRMFDQAVDLIENDPGMSAERIKLYHNINVQELGGISITRMAAGVEQTPQESRYRKLEARAVMSALNVGPDRITARDLKSKGFVSVINSNNHGSVDDFRRYVRENNFGSRGYLIPKDGPDLTGWLPGKIQF